ncbi:DUF2577 domain-containing protein [Paenibacillus sp. IB182496]|uniref:DUF2577 domain-containing protein n=1 Tax=Paenibacillus sabuli TaxID=2772509 RepID=A0A927BUL8_9BACL|nr:DUF2577 domain-containing protein [Paenibacillus sabuli]MBD2846186.1 DUF2577 domain-containing protein [Paenibacillus sabuli]
MAGMLDLIKAAGASAVEAGAPVQLRYGVVASVEPLAITVDQRFSLTRPFLVLTAALQRLTVSVDGSERVVRPGLQPGERVLLVRMQGGQQYVVLDKVVEA